MTLDQFLEAVALLPTSDVVFCPLENKERGMIRFAKEHTFFCPLTAVYFAKTGEVLHIMKALYAAKALDIDATLASSIISSSDGNLGYESYKQELRDLLIAAVTEG